jgi:hypothetical protein
MKKYYIICSLMILLSLVLYTASSQNKQPRQDSYWVIESNLFTPRNSIVYFYNAENQLMYKQTVSGKKLNVNRALVRKKLNDMLNEVNTVWLADKLKRDSIFVANLFKE